MSSIFLAYTRCMSAGTIHFGGAPASIPVKAPQYADGTYSLSVSLGPPAIAPTIPTIVTASGNPISGAGVILDVPFVRMPAGGTLRLRDSTTASGSDLMGGTFTFTEAYTGPLPFLKGVRFVNGVYVDLSGAGAQVIIPWSAE